VPSVGVRVTVGWVTVSTSLGPRQQAALDAWIAEAPGLGVLAERFAAAGHELALVGGAVRDLVRDAGQAPPPIDIDLTTDATPEQVQTLVDGWAHAVWDVGIRFGTVGATHSDARYEITTYRTESYTGESRKPEVRFGTSLTEDLVRRDFSINAMAVRLPSGEFIDPFGGLDDLANGILRTPARADESFSDDPLRMMRAARFVSQLGFDVAEEALESATRMSERITIVSAERVRDELVRLVLGTFPRRGLDLMVATGLAQHVLPELPRLALEIDEHHRHKDVYEHTLTVVEQVIDLESTHEPVTGPDFVLRFAALMHDVGKPRTRRFEEDGGVSFHHHEVVGAKMTRKRMQALRFSADDTEAVSRLVELHLRFHGYGSGEWTDSAVRRYVRDADSLLPRLHKLTRADCTTRNRRKAERLQATYDDLERRIARLSAEEELAAIRPELDGQQIMSILDIPPGPVVGEAYRFLLDLRLDRGPLGEDLAREALLAWWAARNR